MILFCLKNRGTTATRCWMAPNILRTPTQLQCTSSEHFFLFKRCSLTFTDCKPIILLAFIFKEIIRYRMPIKTKVKYRYKIVIAAEKVSLSEDSPTAAFHRLTHASPSGCSTTFQVNRDGQKTTIVMIQVARMKNRPRFELISGERRGYTTALNRSTAIITRLWMDTALDTSTK